LGCKRSLVQIQSLRPGKPLKWCSFSGFFISRLSPIHYRMQKPVLFLSATLKTPFYCYWQTC